MTKKEQPELTVNLRTTLKRFSGFLKVMAIILTTLGVGIGGPVVCDKIFPPEYDKDLRARDSLINLLQEEVATHDKYIDKLNYRVDVIDQNNLEVKTKLISIETDIKTLLYYAGESKGRNR